jgi:hypothetical protein
MLEFLKALFSKISGRMLIASLLLLLTLKVLMYGYLRGMMGLAMQAGANLL